MLEVKNKNSLEAKMKFPKIIMKDLFSHLCLKLLLVEIRDEIFIAGLHKVQSTEIKKKRLEKQ